MTTGSINYSPDYKSKFESAMDEGRKIAESVIAANRAAAERERLRDDIVSAARVWYDKSMGEYITGSPLADAVRALIDFESSQQQIKK